MAYTFTEPQSGFLQIAQTDAGQTFPNSGATVYPTPPAKLGMVVRATDPTYGGGEFILLKGVDSTVVGSVVEYNATTYQTTLSTNTANDVNPVAVAMSACTSGLFGWYQIGGLAVVKKTAVQVDPNVALFQSATAGRVMDTVASGKQILGMRSANLTTVTSTTSTIVALLDRPCKQGQVI